MLSFILKAIYDFCPGQQHLSIYTVWELKPCGKEREGGGIPGRNQNRTNRALKSRLCKAKETREGCELQYWLYAPQPCGGWDVEVGADGPYSPGEKSWVAQETGFIHTHTHTQDVNLSEWRRWCLAGWAVFGSVLSLRCDCPLEVTLFVSQSSSLFCLSVIWGGTSCFWIETFLEGYNPGTFLNSAKTCCFLLKTNGRWLREACLHLLESVLYIQTATFLLKALKDRHRGLFSPSAQIQNRDELQSAETAASGRFHLR